MWQVKSAETYTNMEGLSPMGWEPFAVTYEPSGKYRVWAKREVPDQWHSDNAKFAPEGQKIQDEWKAKLKQEHEALRCTQCRSVIVTIESGKTKCWTCGHVS